MVNKACSPPCDEKREQAACSTTPRSSVDCIFDTHGNPNLRVKRVRDFMKFLGTVKPRKSWEDVKSQISADTRWLLLKTDEDRLAVFKYLEETERKKGNRKKAKSISSSKSNSIQEAIAQKEKYVSIVEEEYNKRLLFAAKTKDIEMTNFALSLGADVNYKDAYDQRTALFEAAGSGSLEIVKLLTENKAQINLRDVSGESPLLHAIRMQHEEIVRFLVSTGADANTFPGSELLRIGTPLVEGIKVGNCNIVRMLLDHGAKVNHVNRDGDTALKKAATKGIELVKLLLEYNAHTEMRDAAKCPASALSLALEFRHLDVVTCLVQHKANVNHSGDVSGNGQTLYSEKQRKQH
eukprot:TRINITY_DN4826_c0_g1_i1.p1 TRINITY_DN4826_c0_g1~~TRINITY_DN4826_c0_g1_i1.p1  ORF type:complete len:351 (+),score=76.01 TRINITY_DN4826_c0_g1_i1:227-1279(+)